MAWVVRMVSDLPHSPHLISPVSYTHLFDTGIVKGIALNLAGVTGIALNGIDAAAVPAKHKPHMVGNAV